MIAQTIELLKVIVSCLKCHEIFKTNLNTHVKMKEAK